MCIYIAPQPMVFSQLVFRNVCVRASWKVKVSVAQLCLALCDPWATAHQAPPATEFSWQEHWSGLPLPASGDLPEPGPEPRSPALQADFLLSEPPGKPIGHN